MRRLVFAAGVRICAAFERDEVGEELAGNCMDERDEPFVLGRDLDDMIGQGRLFVRGSHGHAEGAKFASFALIH
jgi:hypothetical protein